LKLLDLRYLVKDLYCTWIIDYSSLPFIYCHALLFLSTSVSIGVSSDPKDRLNPLRSIISKFEEDDLIIVKLDIDTSQIEVPLAKQLLEDDTINKLVDHFYFEHHVQLYEMKHAWDKSWVGSVQESFELMNGLRNKGVAAHFWV